jgi:hypothetical protein
VGFKAGAGLIIAMTQLPSLIGTAGGGRNFFERAVWVPRATTQALTGHPDLDHCPPLNRDQSLIDINA